MSYVSLPRARVFVWPVGKRSVIENWLDRRSSKVIDVHGRVTSVSVVYALSVFLGARVATRCLRVILKPAITKDFYK